MLRAELHSPVVREQVPSAGIAGLMNWPTARPSPLHRKPVGQAGREPIAKSPRQGGRIFCRRARIDAPRASYAGCHHPHRQGGGGGGRSGEWRSRLNGTVVVSPATAAPPPPTANDWD